MSDVNPICIMCLRDFSVPIVFPEIIPTYLLPVTRTMNQLQYITATMAQTRCQEIWIIAHPAMIPILKENVGECSRFAVNEKRFKGADFKFRIKNVPIYYVEPLRHDMTLRRKEQLWQMVRLATTINGFYRKVSRKMKARKFLFYDSASFYEIADLHKPFLKLRKYKNALISVTQRGRTYDYYQTPSMCLFSIDQIRTLRRFYTQNKKLHKEKKITHREMMSCLDPSTFTNKIELVPRKQSYRFINIPQYFRYINTTYRIQADGSEIKKTPIHRSKSFWVFKNRTVSIVENAVLNPLKKLRRKFQGKRNILFERLRNKKFIIPVENP